MTIKLKTDVSTFYSLTNKYFESTNVKITKLQFNNNNEHWKLQVYPEKCFWQSLNKQFIVYVICIQYTHNFLLASSYKVGFNEKDNFGLELFLPKIFFCSSFNLLSWSFFNLCLSSSIFLCSSTIASLSSACKIQYFLFRKT